MNVTWKHEDAEETVPAWWAARRISNLSTGSDDIWSDVYFTLTQGHAFEVADEVFTPQPVEASTPAHHVGAVSKVSVAPNRWEAVLETTRDGAKTITSLGIFKTQREAIDTAASAARAAQARRLSGPDYSNEPGTPPGVGRRVR